MRLLIIMFLLMSGLLIATDKPESETLSQNNQYQVNFNQEKFNLMRQVKADLNDEIAQQQSKKSGIKAALMSAMIPGLGEAYAKSYWRAALFFAIDVALISSNIIYDNKGDDEDVRMKAFGDIHWDEQTYWSKVYDKALISGLWEGDLLITENHIISNEDYADAAIKQELRDLEHRVGYTHTLPSTKTQQYYEMTYKYLHQFGIGWDDISVLTNGDLESAWTYYDIHANLGNLSPNIEQYRSMRNSSNDYYAMATTMLNLVLLNHVLSAFDAALAVKQFNKKINYAVRVNGQFDGFDRVNTLGLYVSW